VRSVQIVHGSVSGGTAGASSAAHAGHATLRCGVGASSLVDAHHDGVELALKGLLHSLNGCCVLGVALKELKSLVGGGVDVLDILRGEVSPEFLLVEGVLHLEAVVLKSVLGLDLLADDVISSLELLSISDELLDVLLGETALIVGDGDLLGLTSGLVGSGNVEDTVGINVEGDLDLGGTARCGGNAVEVELSEEMVILGHLTLTLVNLDVNSGLVISVGGEGLGLLGGDASVPGDEHGHDTASGLNTLGKGCNIEEKEILDHVATLTHEDSGLDGGTEGNSLIGVDGAVEGLAVEEVGEHGLNLGDSGGATNKDDLVDLRLGDVSILEDLLDGGHALAELGHAELLELSAGDVGVEILTLGESLTVDLGLMGAG